MINVMIKHAAFVILTIFRINAIVKFLHLEHWVWHSFRFFAMYKSLRKGARYVQGPRNAVGTNVPCQPKCPCSPRIGNGGHRHVCLDKNYGLLEEKPQRSHHGNLPVCAACDLSDLN